MKYVLFLLVVLASNIIQGITGFAGTILAMPFSIIRVGFDTCKPILNILGLLSGIYVFVQCRKNVDWKEFKKIIIVMTIGIISGIYLKTFFLGREQILYKILGIFVIFLAVQGLYKIGFKKKDKKKSEPVLYGLLISSGIIHGMFVCGGPLLIGYLSEKIKDKVSFRATISTVWIVLNSIIMVDDIRMNLMTAANIKLLLLTIPALFVGMFIGSILYKKMSQKVFMIITYILLFISGISLLIK